MSNLWISNLPNLLKEKNKTTNLCHGLCSNEKAFVAWGVHKTLTDIRRACGGFGYAKYSILDDLLNLNDLNQTWEGDNHVLIMQTQQFLFKCLRWLSKDEELPETVEFLTLSPPELEKIKISIFDLDSLTKVFSDRANYYVHKASHELMIDATKISQHFEASQAFEMFDMCKAYHDYYLITSFTLWINKITDEKTKKIFEKFLLLSIHQKIINEPKYFVQIFESEVADQIKKELIKTLKELRKDIIPLTDVMPYPDVMLGALGGKDLQIYDRILQHVKATPKVTERPSWWKLAYTNSQ